MSTQTRKTRNKQTGRHRHFAMDAIAPFLPQSDGPACAAPAVGGVAAGPAGPGRGVHRHPGGAAGHHGRQPHGGRHGRRGAQPCPARLCPPTHRKAGGGGGETRAVAKRDAKSTKANEENPKLHVNSFRSCVGTYTLLERSLNTENFPISFFLSTCNIVLMYFH